MDNLIVLVILSLDKIRSAILIFGKLSFFIRFSIILILRTYVFMRKQN